MAEFVRAAVLTGYMLTMKSLGADPLPLLREVGLSEKLLSNPEQSISRKTAMRLVERAVEVTGCATFGLRMAECRGLANLGAVSLLIAHANNLRDAIAALNRYRNQVNEKLVLRVIDVSDGLLIQQDLVAGEVKRSNQFYDLALGVLMKLCTEMLGEEWYPKLAYLMHQPPPLAEIATYRRVFRCSPEFNAVCNGLVIDYSDFERRSRRADTALADHARKLVESLDLPERQSVIQQVEHSTLLLMPSGRATIETCSSLLGMSVRTLQRALEAEGASFSRLIGRQREQLSGEYLANPHISITDVAAMLGYSSISAFSRWHMQTFGISAMARRKSAKAINSARSSD
ncbi:MAG: helix-turn-helix transcriptional regulator [Alphaproteobacteria bacterium]|nr:helix-turn-helix transcriptional regulator [Alphaproteobacteria bacterium]MDE2042123.1 AraC family transcriptional regulator [Alphaproteobacteria bacterium]